MAFVLIKGRFKPEAGLPDGDSVRFQADSSSHWKKLEGRPPKLGTGKQTKGSVQLRFEGIDAIEKGAKKPESTDAKQSMLDLIGYNAASSPEPRGFILGRMTDDLSGRPICFVFKGATAERDGKDDVFLDAARLRKSVNYKQMQAGFAYPLYYNTLFASLRNEFTKAMKQAKAAHKGYWPTDATAKGVTVKKKADLETFRPIWPKLWRRLQEYLRTPRSLSGFKKFLEDKNERIDLLDIGEERGLQDLVKVSGNKVMLTEPPENLRVRGKSGKRK